MKKKKSFTWTMHMFHILTKNKNDSKKVSPTVEYKLKPVSLTLCQTDDVTTKGKIINFWIQCSDCALLVGHT